MPNIWIIKFGFGDIHDGPTFEDVCLGSKPFASYKMCKTTNQS